MLQQYASISPATGTHIAGICKLILLPKEWLYQIWIADFKTGRVLSLPIIPGKEFIKINLLQNTYKFTETPKSTKGGSYFDISLTGSSNDIDQATYQTLETYRYHEFIAIITDRQGRLKIVGNFDGAMIFEFNNSEENQGGGQQKIDIKMSMQLESKVPFYGAVITTPEPKLLFPYPFTATIESLVNIRITWPSGIIWPAAYSVVLQRSTNADFTSDLVTFTVTAPDIAAFSFLDTAVPVNQTFYYRIKITKSGYTDSDYANTTGMITDTAGLVQNNLWLDLNPAEEMTVVTDTGIDYVDTWTDATGSSRGLQYETARPIVEMNGTLSKLVVTNHHNPMAALITIPGTDLLPNTATGMTIYIVGSQSALNDTGGSFLRCGQNIVCARFNDLNNLFAVLRNSGNYLQSSIISNDIFYTIRMQFDGTTQSVTINNGTPITSTPPNSLFNPAVLWLFRRFSLGSNKKIARVVIYTAGNTPAEITQNENYLRSFYGHY